jgi:hypothetical protein
MSDGLPQGFAARSAADKLELLWARVKRDPYDTAALPTQPPGTLSRLRLLSVSHDRASFEHESDEMPAGRVKLVHTYGTVACVTVEPGSALGYTGVFATGGRALLRFSDGGGGPLFTPSLALKFPVDGGPSLNFLALPHAPRRSSNRDPLAGVYANASVSPRAFGAKLVAGAFQRTANALGGKRLFATYLPLHHLAGRTLDGAEVAEPRVPDRLVLTPTDAAREAAAESPDFRVRLGSLPEGTGLFDLALAPTLDAPAAPWGTLRLDTRFVASRWGDERLFFQHDVGPRQ